MSIVVAVRVRPFNQREKDLQTKLCVRMKDNTTVLIDEFGNEKAFSFDYSFWSHDGCREEEDGYLSPVSEHFADQRKVYDKVGKSILENALNGYNCTLFAYGQTGSGKSFSMVGYGKNRGIVPIVTEELFQVVKAQTTPAKRFEINLSMLEIYNEKIQDLLVSINDRPQGGLKVRESKTVGVYVEDLTKHPVGCYADIESKMAEGFKTRTIASTQMNSCSSRAHTIIAVEFKTIEVIENRKLERLSIVNLVDLAGSEKVAKSGAVGDRLKEGCSINKSLSVLGLVITNLADISTGKAKGKVVPYRDSSLTRILQNALGGNSKTLMICAISPSSNNFEESLSTLRYADQAKKIKCHAIINENEGDAKFRELQKENEGLKKMLEMLKSGKLTDGVGRNGSEFEFGNSGTGRASVEEMEMLQKKLAEYENSLKSNQMIIMEYEKSFEERLKEENQKQVRGEAFDYESAHVTNMNEDPQLTGQILYNLDKMGQVFVGRRNANPAPHIILNAIGIQQSHARIEKTDSGYFLRSGCKEAEAYLFVNGNRYSQPTQLFHLDRICFGLSTFFVFKDQSDQRPQSTPFHEADIDWEFCQQEMSRKNMLFGEVPIKHGESSGGGKEAFLEYEKETCKLKAEYEDRMEVLRKQHEEMLEQLRTETLNATRINDGEREELIKMENEKFAEAFQEFTANFQQKIEVTNLKKERAAREVLNELKEKDKEKLERKLVKLNPNIVELNLIARELRRDVVFSPHVVYSYVESVLVKPGEHSKRYSINIKVENKEDDSVYFWGLAKFSSRYFQIKELLHRFYESGSLTRPNREDDPFWDPVESQKLGQCYLKMLSLAYLLDNPNDLVVLGDSGQVGVLSVNILPVDHDNEPLDENSSIFDEFSDDPDDLKGKELRFQVQVRWVD
jgi:kinesin family protein 13